ncbi:MAG TPA: ABC transporter ATP-binding protein [Kiritimatiellia bacterium]|nr:ABC transporter ATP-binding protein [Kiritimatiellia bacterium]HMP33029.1 ABC transporter ATP-binding protein [Kiritimatiellia bacterium]
MATMDKSVPAVETVEVVRTFGTARALDAVSLTIRQGEFFSLLGPSGCGKTTLLRAIGGLDYPDSGTIRLLGQNAEDIPAHKRPVNTVFQSYALFPHMTIEENVGFGLRMKKIPKAEAEARVKKVMDMVQIAQFAGRKPSQLSGGQRQRVALARAIVNEPQVLLLDEPMGALDLKLRKELQVELLTLQRRLGITFICVTHDQEEALVMSDRIAVMRAGKIEQLGDAEELYEHPRTRFVGQFLGSVNLLEARVTSRSGKDILVDTQLGPLRIDSSTQRSPACANPNFHVAIRPEKVALLSRSEGPGENRIPVKVQQLMYIGSETHYDLDAGPQKLSAELMNAKVGSQGYDIGQEALAYLPPAGLIVLDD